MNGPDDLPNVIRYQGAFAFAIQDPNTNLIAFAGLPADISTFVGCGGTVEAQAADLQEAGVRQEVFHVIAVNREANLLVFKRSTFVNLCTSQPIASGVGSLGYVDNDRYITGEGVNSWGFRMHGPVTLLDGSSANLEAHNRFIFQFDGPTRLIHRQVRLTP